MPPSRGRGVSCPSRMMDIGYGAHWLVCILSRVLEGGVPMFLASTRIEGTNGGSGLLECHCHDAAVLLPLDGTERRWTGVRDGG